MKISSSFVDYYDYLSHVYGEDPLLFFNRRNLASPLVYSKQLRLSPEAVPYIPHADTSDFRAGRYFKGLSVCGKHYFVTITRQSGSDALKFELGRSQVKYRWFNKLEYSPGTPFKFLDDIAKEVGQPIYFYSIDRLKDSKVHIVVSDAVPNLSLLSFSDEMSPEQLYQEICYYLANVVNEGIDIKPPTEVSNSDKIVQAGFDLKKSFRHRSS